MNVNNSDLLKDRNFIIVLLLFILIIILTLVGYFYSNQTDTYTFKLKFESDLNNIKINGISLKADNFKEYKDNQTYIYINEPIFVEFSRELKKWEFETLNYYRLNYKYTRDNILSVCNIEVSLYINENLIGTDKNSCNSKQASGSHYHSFRTSNY